MGVKNPGFLKDSFYSCQIRGMETYYERNQEARRTYAKSHYQQNKDAKRAYQKAKKAANPEKYKTNKRRDRQSLVARNAAIVNAYKAEHLCPCGEARMWVLDLHHIADKEENVARLVTNGVSAERVKREMEKCIVLCANCHRDLHHKQRNPG